MKEGDFVLIEFLGRVKATGEVFDLSSAEEAKSLGIYQEKGRYGPGLVIIGAKMAMPGVEEQLKTMKVGEEKSFEIPVDKAVGPRNRKLIKIVSINNFYKQNMNPVPGAMVNIDGRDCKIKSVSGGRVMVDFNHPLAGKELLYRVKIVKKLTDPGEKLEQYLKHFGLKAEASVKEGQASITTDKPVPEPLQKMLEKDIKKWIPEIKGVKFSAKEIVSRETRDISASKAKGEMQKPKAVKPAGPAENPEAKA